MSDVDVGSTYFIVSYLHGYNYKNILVCCRPNAIIYKTIFFQIDMLL